ncbi:MAG: hypothetical protein HUK02_00775 [Bacteroidaceae bacterium]|nr:hypothetical protein [Bacteroidaceae bacterium]
MTHTKQSHASVVSPADAQHRKRLPLWSLRLLCIVATLLCVSLSCTDAIVSNKFCSLRARFRFDNVAQAPQLFHALNSQGEWCSVSVNTRGNYVFANPQGSTEVKPTAIDNYTGVYLGLSGFLVGLPNIPEMGANFPVVTCYDLACPNCYTDFSVSRALTLQEGGFARCGRCQRQYNLNNTGQVQTGNQGRPLYRYRTYFSGQTFSVQNP